jgi:hypothetical protein
MKVGGVEMTEEGSVLQKSLCIIRYIGLPMYWVTWSCILS